MFSFKSKKTTMPGCINLNSRERIVPVIVDKLPSFGTKKTADDQSLFTDALYGENLPIRDGQDKHVWSDSAMNDLVKDLISHCLEEGKLSEFEIKVRSYSLFLVVLGN